MMDGSCSKYRFSASLSLYMCQRGAGEACLQMSQIIISTAQVLSYKDVIKQLEKYGALLLFIYYLFYLLFI